jgi:hypothetical protein
MGVNDIFMVSNDILMVSNYIPHDDSSNRKNYKIIDFSLFLNCQGMPFWDGINFALI